MAGEVVGWLDVQTASIDPDESVSQIEIRGSEEFYLGRSSTFCRHHWADPVISNKHLRIHCVLYEVDGNGEIPPLVYATDISANGTYLTKKNPQCASSQGRGIRMGSTKGAFLLDDGDELRISDSVTLTYHPFYLVDGERLTHVQEEEKKLMSSQYLITERLLGRGGYGKVFVAIQQSTQRQVACKIIDLHRFSPASLQPWKPTNIGRQHGQIKRWPTKVRNCFREIDILQHVYHPNIISLEKVYWSSNSIYIFQELVTGGDLFSYIHHKGGRLCEVETAVIIQQVLKGVEYLHGQDIIHRDLKPDNILMTSFDDGARIVITDFGNARFVPTPSFENRSTGSPRRMFSLVGTLEWSAPEIHKMNRTIPEDYGYSKSIDMWSIGAITTTLLSGLSIFDVQTQALTDQGRKSIILARMAQCDLNVLDDLSDSIWSKIGPRPKDLIKRLLVLREQSRLTATEALQHPWFSSEYYKAEFDALYLRATRNWKPRRKVFRLIEPIPTHVVGNERNSLSGDVLSQEAVSRYFAPPPRKSSLYDVREGLNVLQHRENTLLPSIVEEEEVNTAESNTRLCESPSQYAQQAYDSYELGDPTPQRQSLGDSLDQLTLDRSKIPACENYEGKAYDSGNHGVLQHATPPEVCKEYTYDEHDAYQSDQVLESSMVCETPKAEAKRSHNYPETNSGDEHTSIGSLSQYFAQESAKRRKLE